MAAAQRRRVVADTPATLFGPDREGQVCLAAQPHLAIQEHGGQGDDWVAMEGICRERWQEGQCPARCNSPGRGQ